MSRIDWRAMAPIAAAQIRARKQRKRQGLDGELATHTVLLAGREWQLPKGATLE